MYIYYLTDWLLMILKSYYSYSNNEQIRAERMIIQLESSMNIDIDNEVMNRLRDLVRFLND